MADRFQFILTYLLISPLDKSNRQVFNKNSPASKMFMYISFIMTGVYFILGSIFLFTDYFQPIILNGTHRIILGLVLIFYGGFRIYFLLKKRAE